LKNIIENLREKLVINNRNGVEVAEDKLQEMLDFQRKLQEKVKISKPEYARMFGNELGTEATIADAAEFMLHQKQASDDEFQELMRALGGSDGNASWKYWKKKHEGLKFKKISDLSEEELYALREELIDDWHFFMNRALMLGMTSEMMYKIYMKKNEENIQRQDSGY